MTNLPLSFKGDEQKDWEMTKKRGTIMAYKKFMSTYPNGKFVQKAATRYRSLKEEKDWEIAVKRDRIFAYEKFLELYPSGKYSNEAGIRIEALEGDTITETIDRDVETEEELALEVATNADTVAAYNTFLKQFPNGIYKNEVRNRIGQLEKKLEKQYRFIEEELQAWEYALSQHSLLSFRDFLNRFPNGRYRRLAEAEIGKLEKRVLNKVQNSQKNYSQELISFKSSENDGSNPDFNAEERDTMGVRLSLIWLIGFSVLSGLTFILAGFLFPVSLICGLIAGVFFVYNRGERITNKENQIYQFGTGLFTFSLCWAGLKDWFEFSWISIFLALIAGLLAIFLFRVYFNRQQSQN